MCASARIKVAGEAIGNAINFDNQVLLTTSKVDRTSLQPGETIKVDLTWRGLKTWSADYTAFVHLVGPDDDIEEPGEPSSGQIGTGLILDTSILFADERGKFDMPGFLARFASPQPLIAGITGSELLHGAGRAQDAVRRVRRQQHVEQILASIFL